MTALEASLNILWLSSGPSLFGRKPWGLFFGVRFSLETPQICLWWSCCVCFRAKGGLVQHNLFIGTITFRMFRRGSNGEVMGTNRMYTKDSQWHEALELHVRHWGFSQRREGSGCIWQRCRVKNWIQTFTTYSVAMNSCWEGCPMTWSLETIQQWCWT